MATQGIPVCGEWRIIEKCAYTDEVLSDRTIYNLVVLSGQEMICRFLFGFGGASSIVGLGVGASSTYNTVASSGVSVNDTRLTYELTGNATRKALTNTNNVSLSVADFTQEITTVGSTTYYSKITVQSQFAAGDGNNGNTFQEYGLFDTLVLPSSPTASSGTMFNRLVDPAPITKTASNSLTVQVTLRF